MRILVVSTRLPYPPHQGDRLKMYNTLKRLAREHEIYLLTFIANRKELEYLGELHTFCTYVDVVFLPNYQSFFNCLRYSFTKLPLQVAYYHSSEMHRKIKDLRQKVDFELIHVHLLRMAPYFTRDEGVKKVLDLTDAVSLYMYRTFQHHKSMWKRLFYYWEWQKVKQYERVCESFDKVLLCSEADIRAIEKNGIQANYGVTNNGVDTDFFDYQFFEYQNEEYDPNQIIFTGNMTYYPNIDGILFFYHQIFPKIVKKNPHATLWIVGKDPTPEIIRLNQDERVVVTGFVEDIRPYYRKSAVSISPIQVGAGTLNKILEPMALGVPVVSTSLGGEGFDIQHGKQILFADSPVDFAQQVLKVMEDKTIRKNLAIHARRYIEEHHDWERVVAQLQLHYAELQPQLNLRKNEGAI